MKDEVVARGLGANAGEHLLSLKERIKRLQNKGQSISDVIAEVAQFRK